MTLPRRQILLGSSSMLMLSGCDRLGESKTFQDVLGLGEKANFKIHRTLSDRMALAREFAPSDISPKFRQNGTLVPAGQTYAQHAKENFANWQLRVDGLVERPQALSLAQIRAMPTRKQITRHDCVEGWSAIGKWSGVPLKLILDAAGLRPQARYVVFHCADGMDDDGGSPYYESIDLVDALHPQTILAWALNDQPLPVGNGAPLRLRVERQLGYKHAKFVERIEAVADLSQIRGGKGGYWEDVAGYEWYAGI